MEQSTPNTVSVGPAKNFPILPMFLVVVVAIGGAFTLGYFLRGINVGTIVTPTPMVTATPSLQPTDSTNISISSTPLGTPVVSNPQYTLKIGKNSSLTLPQGWRVTKVFGTYENLTQSELQNIVKESHMLDASIPIFKGAGVEISNGASTINLTQGALYVLGAVGFVPDSVPENWTIVQNPTSDKPSGVGFARYQEGSQYKYETIFVCDPIMCDGKFGHVSTPFGVNMTFTGSSADLLVADNFFRTNVLGKELSFKN